MALSATMIAANHVQLLAACADGLDQWAYLGTGHCASCLQRWPCSTMQAATGDAPPTRGPAAE